MKKIFLKKLFTAATVSMFQLLVIALFAQVGHAAESMLTNIREGMHADHSRIVIDCKGAKPSAIGPALADSVSVTFEDLNVAANIERINSRLRGAVERISHEQRNDGGVIKLIFKAPAPRVKTFVLKPDDKSTDNYRVVLDIFPAEPIAHSEEKSVSGQPAKTVAAAAPAVVVSTPAVSGPQPEVEPATDARVASHSSEQMENAVAVAQASAGAPGNTDISVDNTSEEQDGSVDPDVSPWKYLAEASVVVRASDGEDESAKFEEYRDISQSVSGGLSIEAQKDQRYYVRGQADHIGQDDQFYGVEAGDYGKFQMDLSYDNSIHRYAYDAKTLYSGVGSGVMTLDDALQTFVQAAPTSVETATRLNGFISSADTGDPDVTRDTLKLGVNLFAFDPFNFKLELAYEKREGTRPFAGAFGTTEMVELFEPIDYDTLAMKISGEFASAPVYLNVAYQYSQFTNNTDTLTFDNPLIATDAALEPSSGQIDLAPDNQYHNLSISGAYTKLPWNSQISANAAWGLMLQDDDLVPFTTNTAIAAPALPVNSADAEVFTSLYNLRFTSKPVSYMRLKGYARYYDYDNRTDTINFSSGYVETDQFAVATAITNLPSSYTKTKAGLDLEFDVGKRTGLGVGYQYQRTERENREVGEQEDHTVKLSADNRTLDWLEIRSSYEHTQRDISEYDFDVYLQSGDNLDELPQLRKYDQADLVRDRFTLQTTFYPTDRLSFGASATYGKDDYKDSPYGLTDDSHLLLTFDTDYAIGDRAAVNLFYNYERYENTQRASSGGTPWSAEGEDQVNTVGAGLTLALVPNRLDLDLSYSYSDVDGNISFTSPSGAFADFDAVDDTRIHRLNSKLKYHFNKKLTLTLGHLWEKFDYDDFSTDGFTNVPTDAAGNYQSALLAGTLPEDYDVHIIYTQLTFRYE